MGLFRFLAADSTQHPLMDQIFPGCSGIRFSEEFLASRVTDARSRMRSRSRGVLLLSNLMLELPVAHPANTGLYLSAGFGPTNPRTLEQALLGPPGTRLARLERSLPPKDYFIANPGMKAAQLALEAGLHGPWSTFLSPLHGLAQAARTAGRDLRDGVVKAALVGGVFSLEEPSEWLRFAQHATELSECVYEQCAESADELLDVEGPPGRYGPLTAVIGRMRDR